MYNFCSKIEIYSNLHEEVTKKMSCLRDKCREQSRELRLKANDYKKEADALSKSLRIFTTDSDKWIKTNNEIEIKLDQIRTELLDLKKKLIDYNEIRIIEPKINVTGLVGEVLITNKVEEFSEKFRISAAEGYPSYVYCITLLQNGDLASGSKDTTIKIWDDVNGQLNNPLRGHSNSVRSLTVPTNGDLVSGSYDNTIIFYYFSVVF